MPIILTLVTRSDAAGMQGRGAEVYLAIQDHSMQSSHVHAHYLWRKYSVANKLHTAYLHDHFDSRRRV